MTKKLNLAPELSDLTDDEIYYQGERFIEGLSKVLEEGRAALGNSYEFKLIEQGYRELLKKFKAEEKIAA
ncbi:MAG: hypothetical protein JSS63_09850 [Bacteroidetes bacterium]|nr:hypothetical protein [Bacteroidota bacterium]